MGVEHTRGPPPSDRERDQIAELADLARHEDFAAEPEEPRDEAPAEEDAARSE
jgi:hypothetical protein